MDRNSNPSAPCRRVRVALRKESVDRNVAAVIKQDEMQASLSARRAWIEIALCMYSMKRQAVALRKESVDRNCLLRLDAALEKTVALRKESVDRN